MRAIDFIKEHGIEKARKVVEGIPESGQPLYFNTVNSIYFFTGYRNRYFVNGVWGTEDDHPSIYEYDIKAVSITHLKLLVESVDLVNLKGGVKKLKKEADCLFHNDVEGVALRYEQAISDYESIYKN